MAPCRRSLSKLNMLIKASPSAWMCVCVKKKQHLHRNDDDDDSDGGGDDDGMSPGGRTGFQR